MSNKANQAPVLSTPEHLQNPGALDGQFTLDHPPHLERIEEARSADRLIATPRSARVIEQMRATRAARRFSNENPASDTDKRKNFWDK